MVRLAGSSVFQGTARHLAPNLEDADVQGFFQANALRYLTDHQLAPDLPKGFQALARLDRRLWQKTATPAQRGYARQLRSAQLPRLEIRALAAPLHGGVFAREPIAAGRVVVAYFAELRSAPGSRPAWETAYFFAIPQLTRPVQYQWVARDLVLDARFAGNVGRMVNHSNEPNLMVDYVFGERFWVPVLVAAQPIRVGQQIAFDYKEGYWLRRPPPIALDLTAEPLTSKTLGP